MAGLHRIVERHLTLVVPGLYGPRLSQDPAPGPHAPELETLLARATPIVADPQGADRGGSRAQTIEALLCVLFGVHAVGGDDLPVAATTLLADGGVNDAGWWIRADPVHLSPQGGGLILSGNELLDLSQEEALRLVAELEEVFTPDRGRLEAPRPHRWYLRPAVPTRIRTHSVDEAWGKDINDYLPDGPDSRFWHTLLNEVQMLLHSSPLNAERERRGRPPVNSLWFWGGGPLPQVRRAAWAGVWSSEPLALGLAQLAGVSLHALPTAATHWLQTADAAGSHLLVFELGNMIGPRGDGIAWRQFVESLDERWLSPLLAALRSGELASLTLHAERGAGRRLVRANLRRWWRRRRPLSFYG